MRMTLDEIRNCLGAVGDLNGAEDAVITRVCTDSRKVRAGDLFVCLSGERFDGHRFAEQAVKQGAAAVLAQEPLLDLDAPMLLVTDTLAALGRLAAYYRAGVGAKVVAVTGSAGKTTVKEMIYAILSREMRTAKNYKNFNNQIGLPLSILECSGQEDAWVLELGISLPGDMDELGVIARPDLAVIHNVGPAHLEGLGSLEGVAEAKASLFKYLASGGQALINIDYPELKAAADRHVSHFSTISTRDESAHVFCRYLGQAEDGRGRFELKLGDERSELVVPFNGTHMAEDIAAAAGAALMCGASMEAVAEGLASGIDVDQRFAVRKVGGFTLIDDTYNANPLSMKSSIESAAKMAGDKPYYLVLGDMLELGDEAEAAHREIARVVAESGCRALFYKGKMAVPVALVLHESGWQGSMYQMESAGTFLLAWDDEERPEGVVLFKGSRSCHIEEMVAALGKKLRSGNGEAVA